MKVVRTEELKKLMDSGEPFVLVNVLEREDFEEVHIPGSINIPVDEIEREARKLINKDERVIVHCSGPLCTASSIAADRLLVLGYKKVERFEGGIEEWEKKGFALEGRAMKKAA